MGTTELIDRPRSRLAKLQGRPLTARERSQEAVELAAELLDAAEGEMTSEERRDQQLLQAMMGDRPGQLFTTQLADLCFRTDDAKQLMSYLEYLLKRWGPPAYPRLKERVALSLLPLLSRFCPDYLLRQLRASLAKEMGRAIGPAEAEALHERLRLRGSQGFRVNVNELGEAVLGEQEAAQRVEDYLQLLRDPIIDCISIKASSICSPLDVLAWDDSLGRLKEPLRQLYRAAADPAYSLPEKRGKPKLITLDMEEYRYLFLTVELFCSLLDEEEFLAHSAGIVLQSYLPDSYLLQKRLTEWAQRRCERGGAPIRLRIVKGANLAMERLEAALCGWEQAPFREKWQSDANFKKMLLFGSEASHVQAVHLGVASHNLFDVAYGLVLQAERQLPSQIGFEMLEGMAPHLQRVVQQVAGSLLLYMPIAKEAQFYTATAYLLRRLDENSAPGHFLHALFGMKVGDSHWKEQKEQFLYSCAHIEEVDLSTQRAQNRALEEKGAPSNCERLFVNESFTDWSLAHNRAWLASHLAHRAAFGQERPPEELPLVIGGSEEAGQGGIALGEDPSRPGMTPYRYQMASQRQGRLALDEAKKAAHWWGKLEISRRAQLLSAAAKLLRQRRGELIAAMVCDGGKTAFEADIEVAEAIDFCEYYRRSALEIEQMEELYGRPRGVALVATPWNFPCAISVGGIAANLVAGNVVLYKPAPQTVLVGWKVAQLFWEAGVSRQVLQFLTGSDEELGEELIASPELELITLTGSLETAYHFLKRRPRLALFGETGGKNSLIVTEMADKELAIRDLLTSAFGHAGQKCSACSLLIVTGKLASDEQFFAQLVDGAKSLHVGSCWDLATRVGPLIEEPSEKLQRAFELEAGEEWLLAPKIAPYNRRLCWPSIKRGVQPASFCFETELFGPLLSVVAAADLPSAIAMTKKLPYALTAGLHSLDEREQALWLKEMEAGNYYINRSTTGAMVERQPFGGYKKSCFGPGAKAGGPNYVAQFMQIEQQQLPETPVPRQPVAELRLLEAHIASLSWDGEQLAIWRSSIESYSFFWHHYFQKEQEPGSLPGQRNLLCYRPNPRKLIRFQEEDSLLDMMRTLSGAVLVGGNLSISASTKLLSDPRLPALLQRRSWASPHFIEESEEQLAATIDPTRWDAVRFLSEPHPLLSQQLADKGIVPLVEPPLATGRYELLRYLREVAISYDYHRYGYLGDSQGEEGNLATS